MSEVTDPLHVAIDGPAGSGKSTVARRVADALGLTHVDTGAMYRALTWVAQQRGLSADDGEGLAACLEGLDLRFRDGEIVVDGVAPGEAIRSASVDGTVSQVSAHPAVRRAMQRRQRAASWAHPGGTVMEGRDIGSEVLPLARCKVYLDASVEERARRRARQAGRGEDGETLSRVVEELSARDRLDSEREVSPLRIPVDAHLVDTTELTLDEVVAEVVRRARDAAPRPVDPLRIRAHGFRHGHYRTVHALAKALFELLFRVEVYGREHQEIDAGVIYACNHVSWWDPPLLGAFIDRQVSFLAKRELFKGFFGWFLTTFGVVPIIRGRYDSLAFDATRDVLKAGGNVAIFPEGTRKPLGRPGPMKRGLGILALSTEAPWIPCFVRGTTRPWAALSTLTPMELWMGPPTHARAAEALRARGMDEPTLQARIGDLYLAQVRALAHRAETVRPAHG